MEYHSDIGLVNAHAEGVGGNDDALLVLLPLFLPLVAGRVFEPGVIEGGGDAVLFEEHSQFLALPPASCIDDGTARGELENVDELSRLVIGVAHDIGQIAAVEAHAVHILLLKQQPLLYVINHLWRSGGGEGQHWRLGFDLTKVSNVQIGGAEVVAPLTDAVGFVNGDEAHLQIT